MKIKEIKREIYKKLQWLIFWRKLMFTYRRVRLTQEKAIKQVEPTETIDLPDLEMWAIYNSKEEFVCLHFTEEEANKDCLDRIKEAKLKSKGPK